MFANSIRARAHSHGHAHDCRHGHAHGYYLGHKKNIWVYLWALPMATITGMPITFWPCPSLSITLSIGTPEIHNIKGKSPLRDRGLSVTLTSHWASRSHLALSSSLLCHCLLLPAAPGPRPPIPTFPESTFHLPS